MQTNPGEASHPTDVQVEDRTTEPYMTRPPGSPPAPPPGGPPRTTGSGVIRPNDRPTGITILAGLFAIAAVFALFGAFFAFAGSVVLAPTDLGVADMGAFAVVLLVVAAVSAVVAWGLFTQERWAWYAAIILTALSALSSLAGMFSGAIFSNLVGLVVAGAVIWYLLKPEVQAWFGVRHDTPWKYGRPT